MDKDFSKALDEVFAPFNRSDAPGLVVGVALKGRTIYRRGFGLASLELGVANQPATRMRIGSTSKQVAAFAALLLVQEGLLDLDAPARKFLPELPDEAGDVTLRHLMTHTSGLRDYLDMGFLTDGPAIKPAGTAMRVQTSHRARNFGLGEKATYNNGGYHMLSVAIDRVAGMTLEAFVQQRLFEPLGMKDTAWSPSDFDVNAGMASLYVPTMTGGWRKGMFPSEEVRAEGGLVSTVGDMLRWVSHLRTGGAIKGSDGFFEQMTQPAKLSSGIEVPYGLGLMLGVYRGAKIVHHPGNVFGGACQMLTLPDHALDIVVITNGALVSPVDLAEKIVDVVLADANLDAPRAPANVAPSKSLVGKTYGAVSSGMVVKFDAAGDSIAASISNNPPIPLTNDDGDLRLPFEKVAAGPFVFQTAKLADLQDAAPEGLTMLEGGHAEQLVRLDAAPSVDEMAAELVGNYLIADLQAPAELKLNEGRLELHITGRFAQAMLVLDFVSKDLAVWQFGSPTFPIRGTARIDRTPAGKLAICIDTLRTRGLRAERL